MTWKWEMDHGAGADRLEMAVVDANGMVIDHRRGKRGKINQHGERI